METTEFYVPVQHSVKSIFEEKQPMSEEKDGGRAMDLIQSSPQAYKSRNQMSGKNLRGGGVVENAFMHPIKVKTCLQLLPLSYSIQ